MPRRRRPGQRAVASKAEDRSGYDLSADKRLRARAKFERLSLGRTTKMYGDDIRLDVFDGRSYIAKSEHPSLVDFEMVSDEELALIVRLNDFAEGRSTSLRQLNPTLHEKILRISTAIAKEQLNRMRRAKHTPYMLAHARYLASLPRYRPVEHDEELSECIPY